MNYRNQLLHVGWVVFVAVGAVFGGCADEAADRKTSGVGATGENDAGGEGGLETNGHDAGGPGASEDARGTEPKGTDGGEHDASDDAGPEKPIGSACEPSEGWQEPTVNNAPPDGPLVWTDLGPGVGWCDMNPLQANYPKGSWTVTCDSDSDCPDPSACDPFAGAGTCRNLCHSDEECAPPSDAPSVGYATSCRCTGGSNDPCFCTVSLMTTHP